MSTTTCPYCGADTRPGDNFCLNCGNRLLPASSSPQQAQPAGGDTVPPQEGWAQGTVPAAPPASGSNWGVDPAAPTIASSNAEPPTVRSSDSAAAGNSSAMPTIDQPAKFILRSENGDVIQEYPLEKSEVSIGRAPNSDILLSKDKLTSRRHATVRFENKEYVLYDERSANGTFVNGQQLEEMTPRVLQDGDHVGIGEHELIFRANGVQQAPPTIGSVADMPTMAVQYNPAQDMTYRTQEDELITSAPSDDFSTRTMDNGTSTAATQSPSPAQAQTYIPDEPQVDNIPEPVSAATMQNNAAPPAPTVSTPNPSPVNASAQTPSAPSAQPTAPPYAEPSYGSSNSYMESTVNASPASTNANVTFNRLTGIPQPSLPDIAPLLAALSALDGQVMSLQEQLNATQDAVRNHESEIAQTANQLRAGVRRVTERMDNTIADVARNREALAWTDLLQLMDDVMNNPRDIEYVIKLSRKARELNKVFQLHQNVLNTLAECNSLLRSLLGEDSQR